MAKAKTKNIFVGDSFFVHYRCWRNLEVQQARTQFGGTEANLAREPLTPLSASVKLVNFETTEVIPIGPNGSATAVATVKDNVVTYLIGGEFFAQEGSYRIYTTFVLDNDQVMTEVLQFRVTTTG